MEMIQGLKQYHPKGTTAFKRMEASRDKMILKQGKKKKLLPGGYRPTTLLSETSKVMDRIVLRRTNE